MSEKFNIELKLAFGFFFTAVACVASVIFVLLPVYGLVGGDVIGAAPTGSVTFDKTLQRAQMLTRILVPLFILFFIASLVFLIIGVLKATKAHGR